MWWNLLHQSVWSLYHNILCQEWARQPSVNAASLSPWLLAERCAHITQPKEGQMGIFGSGQGLPSKAGRDLVFLDSRASSGKVTFNWHQKQRAHKRLFATINKKTKASCRIVWHWFWISRQKITGMEALLFLESKTAKLTHMTKTLNKQFLPRSFYYHRNWHIRKFVWAFNHQRIQQLHRWTKIQWAASTITSTYN